MSKVELAKLLGLETTGYTQNISQEYIENLLEHECMIISETFIGGIEVEIKQEDFTSDKLNIKPEDLVEQGDIDYCIKQVVDLIWERAADEYLLRIKRAALLVGGE